MSTTEYETKKRQEGIAEIIEQSCDAISEILNASGAIISSSHLVLTSGQHSDGYINLRKLAGNATYIELVASTCSDIIRRSICDQQGYHIPYANILLVGPETMGRSFAEATACYTYWNGGINLEYAWCEPNIDKTAMQWNSKLDFKERIAGKSCYIIDDVLTTAKTVKQTIDLITADGGKVEGVIVVVQRNLSITAADLGVPMLSALYKVDLCNYDAQTCPLCAANRPMLLRPGHGQKWIETHPDYPTVE